MRPGTLDTSDRPMVLIWELTQACGLACDHCRADARPNRHPDELSTAEGKRLLEDAAEFGDGQLVVLSGGDPLVRDDVEELIAHGDDLGLRMTITPSGTGSLTADRIRAMADAGLKRMAVSIDGASPESHDEFRGETGSFEETVRAVEDAKAAGLPVQVNTTVCRQTVGELPEIRDLLREIGAVMWSVFFLVPVGRGRILEPIDPDEADAVMAWLDEVSDEEPFGLKTTEAPHYRRVSMQRQRARADENGDGGDDDGRPPSQGLERRGGIVAGDGFAFVSHTGEVFPSGFLPESAGNVRERPVTELYRESDLFRALRDRDNLSGKCGACPYRHVCGGSRSRAFATTGDPLASDPLCPYVPEGYDGPLPWEAPETTPGQPSSSD
ncbi:TIGR04053 family radical SAM/SPASM domain-containing protein [Haloterrigena sp. SYSU A558-1]|uniref:TIGR04053 family radical SAM/SPASM domain-containing protein n=1 Tax=Haloterrigena gelatinilytica TaxID=2741724 RepID=A0A8J8GL31_9EURY|nr:TIGR04053 family radical SAM/SPASM domain-containing protein [Haloterrigena gelatinilytica]NUB92003.1 TIGR04053 family radical SAM/SPASM domain-containing protein [Haloterrigena gelatinilytica]NUC72171.1 TIGR04053 family radical SAM/SPASM domain-containing protein [Haloterrigena gelatinilytica]